MGEAFKRARAEAFEHKRNTEHQESLDADLFRMSRRTQHDYAISTRITEPGWALDVGCRCLIAPLNGTYQVIYGNTTVSKLPAEGAALVRSLLDGAPSFNNLLPCRVVERGAFGRVSLKPDVGGTTDE